MRFSSLVRRDVQLKGLAELESRRQSFRADVDGTSMSKTRSLEISGGEQEGHAETAPEDCQRKMYEELKLEEQRAKEALVLVQKKHKLIKWEGERERARTMQRLEVTRTMSPWSGHAPTQMRKG